MKLQKRLRGCEWPSQWAGGLKLCSLVGLEGLHRPVMVVVCCAAQHMCQTRQFPLPVGTQQQMHTPIPRLAAGGWPPKGVLQLGPRL